MKKKVTYFFEGEVPFDTIETKIGFRVKKGLYSGKSSYQKIHIFDLYFYGKTLFLDRVLQTAEKDEFIYHEMLCQAPLFVHSSPRRVLIVGGGDGGSLEEVLKHISVQEAWMVEIDKKVVDISRKYLPSISKNAFQDKRAHLIYGDGKEFITKREDFFDVVILDLSDPGGPARNLISQKFYDSVKRSLHKNGIVSIQLGSLTTQPGLITLIKRRLQKVFRFVQIRGAVVPSYQAGLYSFMMASDFNFLKVSQSVLEKKFKNAKKMNLKYWSPEIHEASAVLPLYLKQELK
ncbi:MAG: polyamine aminopropyltransferase [bacterium]|nr:polyamine aminopropyltransferase [bacterium]